METAPPVRRIMSHADAAWLQMEHPTNLMMITGLFLFDQPVDFKRFQATIECRLLRYPRFRRFVVEKQMGRPHWHTDPDFDLDNHVLEHHLPAPGDKETLLELVSQLMSEPLDRSRPLWEFRLVQNVEGGSALVARLHHAIGDGMALMRVLLNLTDEDEDAPWPEPQEPIFSAESRAPRSGKDVWKATWKRTTRIFQGGAGMMVRSKDLVDLTKAAGDLGKLFLLEPDPATPFQGELGPQKQASVSLPIDLGRVKEVRIRCGGTVNDVLVATLTGALHRYLMGRGEKLADDEFIRVVVPVDLRGADDYRLGNRFGMVFLGLPIGLPTPRARLEEVKRRMDALKGSGAPQAIIVFGLLLAVGPLPAEMEKRVVEFFGANATAVVTNVPGPQEPLYFAGQEVSSLMFWVPQSGRLGMGVSILSYAGQVRVGLATDVKLVPDPHRLVRAFQEEFEALWESEVVGRDRLPGEGAVWQAVDRFYTALNAMFAGEPGPMTEVWSHADDVTYMGPGGGYRIGWEQVRADWEAQAALQLGGWVDPEDIQVTLGPDLAVVNNYEKGENEDGVVSIRATNVFRKEDGHWKMIGHHADPLPHLQDQSTEGS